MKAKGKGGKEMQKQFKNKIVLLGTVECQPVVGKTFQVSIKETIKDSLGNKQVIKVFHTIKTEGKVAEACAKYLSVNNLILVEGVLYKSLDGSSYVKAREISFIHGHKQEVK